MYIYETYFSVFFFCKSLLFHFLYYIKKKFFPSITIKEDNIKEPKISKINNNINTSILSVNYHFTRQCNYKCEFCFHTNITSFVLPLDEAKRGLHLLQEAGMKKINFSGGEPFIHTNGSFVGKLVQYCKEELNIESVTIVSNGSRIKERWFQEYGRYLDILAISCDSFDEDTNKKIGRYSAREEQNHVRNMEKIRSWCYTYNVLFKINSVINTHNINEDMNHNILRLNPIRWKVFQCLAIEGENYGPNALRQVQSYIISDKQFQDFIEHHKNVPQLVQESNEKMRNSYLILDEYMRFLNNQDGKKVPSKSILDVGVENALKNSGFDEKMFFERGGKYEWSKIEKQLEW